MKRETKIISAFPGTGKTFVSEMFKNSEDYIILDSDSSTFDKKEWPSNYINYIGSKIGEVDIIFISSHKEVRDMLTKLNIPFNLIYPKKTLKKTYINRYKKRKSTEEFITYVESSWADWIDSCEQQEGCNKIILQKGEYILDVLKKKNDS